MSSPKNSDSPQVKLMREWGQAFEEKDLDRVAKTLHKDYRHISYPRSLGRPEKNREEWLEYIAGVTSLWTEQKQTLHSIIDTPGKVILHVTNDAKTSIGVEMSRESIFIAHIVPDEDGSLKIKLFEGFTDSKVYLDSIQAIAAVKAKA